MEPPVPCATQTPRCSQPEASHPSMGGSPGAQMCFLPTLVTTVLVSPRPETHLQPPSCMQGERWHFVLGCLAARASRGLGMARNIVRPGKSNQAVKQDSASPRAPKHLDGPVYPLVGTKSAGLNALYERFDIKKGLRCRRIVPPAPGEERGCRTSCLAGACAAGRHAAGES